MSDAPANIAKDRLPSTAEASFAALAGTELQPALPQPSQGLLARCAFPVAYAAIGVLVAALFAGVLKINHGTFLYTLDDPYIHLALSDQIRHGNYGLYPGTHAAPSSSILFPLLLAPASGTSLHPFFPLLINIACLFVTVEIVRRFILCLRLGSDDFAVIVQAAALVLFAVSFNLIGVAFTGLEHSLHIALIAATVYGLTLLVDRHRMPAWLPVVLVLAPLVRYEGLALSVGAMILMALLGRRRAAALTFFATILLLGAFSFFLVKLGLSPLPSSVMVKSAVAVGTVGGGLPLFLHAVIKATDTMIGHPVGLPLLLVGIIACTRFAQDLFRRPYSWTANGLMSVPLLCLIGGHAVAGRFGWLERYEDYVLFGTCLMSLFIASGLIRSALSFDRSNTIHESRSVLVVGGVIAILLVGARYIRVTAQTPEAANNVYEQQFQMHRFIDGYYRGPVAVNDLGLVSYRNPYPVLDLGGLGSEKARLMIARRASPDTYRDFVAANGVHLVMVYRSWFADQIPDDWMRVATLSLSRPIISAADNEVQFYATDASTAALVRGELQAFRPTLPPGVGLSIY